MNNEFPTKRHRLASFCPCIWPARLSIYLFIYLSISLSVCLSIYLSIYLSISINPPLCLFLFMKVCCSKCNARIGSFDWAGGWEWKQQKAIVYICSSFLLYPLYITPYLSISISIALSFFLYIIPRVPVLVRRLDYTVISAPLQQNRCNDDTCASSPVLAISLGHGCKR